MVQRGDRISLTLETLDVIGMSATHYFDSHLTLNPYIIGKVNL